MTSIDDKDEFDLAKRMAEMDAIPDTLEESAIADGNATLQSARAQMEALPEFREPRGYALDDPQDLSEFHKYQWLDKLVERVNQSRTMRRSNRQLVVDPIETGTVVLDEVNQRTILPAGYMFVVRIADDSNRAHFYKPVSSDMLQPVLQQAFEAIGMKNSQLQCADKGIWINGRTIGALRKPYVEASAIPEKAAEMTQKEDAFVRIVVKGLQPTQKRDR